MRKLLILLSLFIFTSSCNYTPKKVSIKTDYCLLVEDYNKTICLDYPSDTLKEFIFIDKNRYESDEEKFKGLSTYIMMVVDIEGDLVTFSNTSNSIKVKFRDNDIPVIQDMYYIICKEDQLSESVLVNFSFNFQEVISGSDSNQVEIIEEP